MTITKEEFIKKYNRDLAGRVLQGLQRHSETAVLGTYAAEVFMGCHLFLEKIYIELVPAAPPLPVKGTKNEQQGANGRATTALTSAPERKG